MGDENVIAVENDEQTIGQPVVENEFAAIKAHLDEGLELTDDEVDAIADAAVGFLKGILACFV